MVIQQEVALARIAVCTSKESLKNFEDNALRLGHQSIVEACATRRQALRKVVRAPARPAAAPRYPGGFPEKVAAYLGGFPDRLADYLARQPDKRLELWLPLADEQGGNPRHPIPAAFWLDDRGRIRVQDLDRMTSHSSLSDLRKHYAKEGAGSESWPHFLAVSTGRTVAETLEVDPNDAHQSRRTGRR